MMEFTDLIDLASERLGGAVVYANDDFFAPKENLLKPSAPIFIEGKYTDRGKWMDGWESRRRRTPGFDWCVVRLGVAGRIRGVLVDTSFFRGNYPEQCSLEACHLPSQTTVDDLISDNVEWVELLSPSELQGDSQNHFEIFDQGRFTHLRFKIYPDGGVARLRIYGEVLPDWKSLAARGEIDLAAVENGGRVLAASDMFFGHRHNMIMPGRALNMSDGWETKRRRGPGYDWAVVELGTKGRIDRVEVDTAHFKGNFPESCALEACSADRKVTDDLSAMPWRELLPRTPLQAHTRHFYEKELLEVGAVTHVRLNIFPDGGISRLRVFGRVAASFPT
jgi:allantoicase